MELRHASAALELLLLDQARDAREVERPDFNLEVGPTFAVCFLLSPSIVFILVPLKSASQIAVLYLGLPAPLKTTCR